MVRGGGIAIIGSIIAILFVIFWEVYPLLRRPTLERFGSFAIGKEAEILAVGTDEYREFAYLVDSTGPRFYSLKTGALIDVPARELGGATVTAVSSVVHEPFLVGFSDGRAVPVKITFPFEFASGVRESKPELVIHDPIVVDPTGRPLRAVAYADSPRGPVVAALLGERELAIVSITETTPLVGEPIREQRRETLSLDGLGEFTTLAVDLRGDNVFVGDSNGRITRVLLKGGDKPKIAEATTIHEGVRITAMNFLIGDRTLIVGDEQGGVSSWQLLRIKGGERLTRVNDFEPHSGAVTAFSPSLRHKGFLSADRGGEIKFRFGTTGETLLSVHAATSGVSDLVMAPKSNGALVVTADGALESWELYAPHPETTLRSLFGKVWYEGYDKPEYVWQSTGGTDDFEPKISLTPLVYGTLKGTFYALIIAIPLALFGALYASQFMHPTLKSYVKPTVEIMAALPSVVLGFIAGLWLAPAVERIVPGLFLLPFVEAGLILLVVYFWRFMPGGMRTKIRAGTEVFLLIPLVFFGGWLAIQLGYVVEAGVLGGDYRRWLVDVVGLPYDQRNSLVVGLAMGFAVIPIIFTIAEDSLTSVPNHLRAGSLALGATAWQTATRVILPTASPGIFSAVMIGFGRAVGETMIVLMATGNTPVMEASIFSGLRALSANIAVELPEAPEGGTLYRVLFLAALLLFLTTFVVNTAAELVRLRLRNRYRVL